MFVISNMHKRVVEHLNYTHEDRHQCESLFKAIF